MGHAFIFQVSHLSLLGGITSREMVKRVMPKVLGSDGQKAINWSGVVGHKGNGDVKTPFKGTHLADAVIGEFSLL